MKKDQKYIMRTLGKRHNVRKEKIEIRCTKLEKERIQHNAKPLSTSDYLRELGLKGKTRLIFSQQAFQLVDQIKYLNNNINQLTKLFHTNKNELSNSNNLEKLLEYLEINWTVLVEIKDTYFTLK